MLGSPLDFLLLLAQAPAGGGAAGAPQQPGGFLGPLLPVLPVIVLFYFMMIRPQQAQERRRKEMIAAIKRNDRVLTSGGMYATVVSVDKDKDRVVLRVDDDAKFKMTFTKSSIAKVLELSDVDKDAKALEKA